MTRALFLGVLLILVDYADAGMGGGAFMQVHDPSAGHPNSLNCTWRYITQPIDHFTQPAGQHTYQERYCIYDKYWAHASLAGFSNSDMEMAPILFYSGNEGPVEQYCNNTGLMWNLGKKMRALIVFAEHRFEGRSFPKVNGQEDCVAFGTTAQALADYSALITALKKEYNTNAPVIAFGGSYGGMLAGWHRIIAPDIITGAIAASAPVKMIMSSTSSNYRGGWEAISRGMTKTGGGGASDNCFTNFRSIQQLASFIGETAYG
jgi:lysosomal Pro-X carboxypeptidase